MYDAIESFRMKVGFIKLVLQSNNRHLNNLIRLLFGQANTVSQVNLRLHRNYLTYYDCFVLPEVRLYDLKVEPPMYEKVDVQGSYVQDSEYLFLGKYKVSSSHTPRFISLMCKKLVLWSYCIITK